MKKLIVKFPVLLLAICSFFFIIPHTYARDASQITDWYIKDFQSDVVVNEDSSIDVTEKIVADCGNLPDKHGIFRVLPLFYQKTENEKVRMPIKLISITDFDGASYKYSQTRDGDSVTWKIGDADKTVTGINNYKITYHIDNTIRFDSADFDEFYWNLNGNFWQIKTDHFLATIYFPIEPLNKTIDLYSGSFGEKDQGLATYSWEDSKTLKVESIKTLLVGEGITVSATFAKDFFSPYTPTFLEKYGQFFWLLLPLLTFFFCFRLWRKYGRDPKLHKAEMVQYEPPKGLGPIECGMILSNLGTDSSNISAGIIDLAVKGILKIEEIPKKGIFSQKDFKITFLSQDFESNNDLSPTEKKIASEIYSFSSNNSLKLNSLKNKFYTSIPKITQSGKNFLFENKYFGKQGFTYRIVLFVLAGISVPIIFGLIATVTFFYDNPTLLISSFVANIIILIIFALIIPSRTVEGAEAVWKINGFKLFMTKAEKYRAPFHEKEGLFEKYLPYAMIFGVTKMWVENMKKI